MELKLKENINPVFKKLFDYFYNEYAVELESNHDSDNIFEFSKILFALLTEEDKKSIGDDFILWYEDFDFPTENKSDVLLVILLFNSIKSNIIRLNNGYTTKKPEYKGFVRLASPPIEAMYPRGEHDVKINPTAYASLFE